LNLSVLITLKLAILFKTHEIPKAFDGKLVLIKGKATIICNELSRHQRRLSDEDIRRFIIKFPPINELV
jgi:hypothetical protein